MRSTSIAPAFSPACSKQLQRLWPVVALVAALSSGCGKGAGQGSGDASGVGQGTFTITVQNGQGQPNDALKIRGGRVFTDDLSINCGVGENGEALTACSKDVPVNTTVVLKAAPSGVDSTLNPARPFQFLGWSGDCSGEGECSLTGNADKYVVASFSGRRTGHPNFSSPTVHEAQWIAYEAGAPGALDCKSCHGNNLQGVGIAVSCSGCHDSPLSPIRSFVATPAAIVSGGSATLSWTVNGATSLSIDHGVGPVTGTQVTVSPTVTTTYTLSATGSTGTTATRSATVSVEPAVGSSNIGLPSDVMVDVQQGSQASADVAIRNGGALARSATFDVVNPFTGLGVSVAAGPLSLPAGAVTSVRVQVDASIATAGIYEGLLLSIALDDGTIVYANIKVTVNPPGSPSLPDVVVRSSGVRLTSATPGVSMTLAADVRNAGPVDAPAVRVSFFRFGTLIGTDVLSSLPAGASATVAITAPTTVTNGNQLVTVIVDPADAILESDESNNQASQVVRIGSPSQALGEGILVTGSMATQVCSGSAVTLFGHATYDLVVDGVRTDDYVVKGAPVETTVQGPAGASVFPKTHTNTLGDFSRVIAAPVPGIYRVFTTVTDKTFTGTRELVFTALAPSDPKCSATPPPPAPPPGPGGTGGGGWGPVIGGGYVYSCPGVCPSWPGKPGEPWVPMPSTDVWVWSEDIYFSSDAPAVGEEVTVFARIQYWSSDTRVPARSVPVTIYATKPGSPREEVGHAVIDQISVGSPDYGGRYVFGTWRVPAEGVYIIEFAIDDDYEEAYVLNNAATRAIVVGEYTGTLGAVAGHASGAWGGVADAIVTVYDAVNAIVGSTVTDHTGFYLVENVPPGAVRVGLSPPAPYGSVATKNTTVATHALSTVDFDLSASVIASGPVNCGDLVEEDVLARWSSYAPGFTTNLSTIDAPDVVRGARAVRATTDAGFDFALVYTAPSNIDASGYSFLRFAIRGTNTTPLQWQVKSPVVVLEDSSGRRRTYSPATNRLNSDGVAWVGIAVPLAGDALWAASGDAIDFASIRRIEIHTDTWDYGFSLDVDALSFDPPGATCSIASSSATATLGTAGGTVALGNARVIVPFGALDAPTPITITVLPQLSPAGTPLYEFSMPAATFAVPVRVRLPVPPGVPDPSIFWERFDGSGFYEIGGPLDAAQTLSPHAAYLGRGYVAQGTATRTITASAQTTYISESSRITVPTDLAGAIPEVLVPNGSGGFTPTPGVAVGNGLFVIAGIPEGEYLLRSGRTYLVGNTGAPDLGTAVVGRPRSSLTPVETAAYLDLTLTGLEPWEDGDWLEIASTEADAWEFPLDDFADPALLPGDTGARIRTNVGAWRASITRNLIEGSRGHSTVVAQLQFRPSANGVWHNAMTHLSRLAPFDLVQGGEVAVSGALQPVTDSKTISFDWRGTAWVDAIRAANPTHDCLAQAPSTCESVVAVLSLPGYAEDGDYWTSLDPLFFYDYAGADFVTGEMTYGSPAQFGGWSEVMRIGRSERILRRLAGTTSGGVFADSMYMSVRPSVAQGIPLAPQVTMPLNAFVDGLDFSTCGSIGSTPTVSWQPPSVGTPEVYTLSVTRLFVSGDRTATENVATVVTPHTTFTFPPGVFTAGEAYVIRLRANDGATAATADTLRTAPLRVRNDWSQANRVSGICRTGP